MLRCKKDSLGFEINVHCMYIFLNYLVLGGMLSQTYILCNCHNNDCYCSLIIIIIIIIIIMYDLEVNCFVFGQKTQFCQLVCIISEVGMVLYRYTRTQYITFLHII